MARTLYSTPSHGKVSGLSKPLPIVLHLASGLEGTVSIFCGSQPVVVLGINNLCLITMDQIELHLRARQGLL